LGTDPEERCIQNSEYKGRLIKQNNMERKTAIVNNLNLNRISLPLKNVKLTLFTEHGS